MENARNIHVSSKVSQLERETQHAVLTHANTSNGIKIPTSWKKLGDDVILVQCLLTIGFKNPFSVVRLTSTLTTTCTPKEKN